MLLVHNTMLFYCSTCPVMCFPGCTGKLRSQSEPSLFPVQQDTFSLVLSTVCLGQRLHHCSPKIKLLNRFKHLLCTEITYCSHTLGKKYVNPSSIKKDFSPANILYYCLINLTCVWIQGGLSYSHSIERKMCT